MWQIGRKLKSGDPLYVCVNKGGRACWTFAAGLHQLHRQNGRWLTGAAIHVAEYRERVLYEL